MRTFPICLLPGLFLTAIPALAEAPRFPAAFDQLVPPLMATHQVPGVSIAWVQHGEVAWQGHYGVRHQGSSDAVGPETIFEAASMSKPVFAYLVMQQVQAGRLDLDESLVTYWGGPYAQAQEGHESMTLRQALSHAGGMPNWRPGGRRGGGPIPQLFKPGTGYTYSGEGMWFAQQAVEKHLGTRLDEWASRDLFTPLGMTRSSYVWRPDFADNAAQGHDQRGRPVEGRTGRYTQPNAAFTLYTTPADYARFLIEMMNSDRSAAHSISTAWVEVMTTPTVKTDRDSLDRGQPTEGSAFFGLGWRVDQTSRGPRILHTGSNASGFRCFSEFDPATGHGVVIMTNSASGHHVYTALRRALGSDL